MARSKDPDAPLLLKFIPGLRARLEALQEPSLASSLTGLINQVLAEWATAAEAPPPPEPGAIRVRPTALARTIARKSTMGTEDGPNPVATQRADLSSLRTTASSQRTKAGHKLGCSCMLCSETESKD